MCDINEINVLVNNFRYAMDCAKANGEFSRLIPLYIFPNGCCDMACDLLANYLADYGVETYVINGEYWDAINGYSINHVWLVLSSGDIIDITGDQFKNDSQFFNYNKKVHIGKEERLHKLFVEKRSKEAYMDLDGISNIRRDTLNCAYRIISKYLK